MTAELVKRNVENLGTITDDYEIIMVKISKVKENSVHYSGGDILTID